jgi:tRNA-dihydrouridine synthase
VFTAEDAVRLIRQTGVDIAWIARGAIGNPWVFAHAAALLADADCGASIVEGRVDGAADPRPPTHDSPRSTIDIRPPSIHEQREALSEHFGIAMQIHGEQLAGRRMRKMGIKYSRFHPRADQVKREFIAVHSLRDWQNVLANWYATDGPGVWPAANAADEVNADPAMQGCEAAA